MAMEKMGGSRKPVSDDALTIDSTTTIDILHDKLGAMWVYYINQRVWSNPVLLTTFFGEYQAYAGTYAEFVSRMRYDAAHLIERETNRIYAENTDKPVTYIDGLIRRTSRTLEAKAVFHESALSACNKNVNAMQTLIRTFGDEAKIMAGNAV